MYLNMKSITMSQEAAQWCYNQITDQECPCPYCIEEHSIDGEHKTPHNKPAETIARIEELTSKLLSCGEAITALCSSLADIAEELDGIKKTLASHND